MTGSGRIVVAAGRSIHGARALERGIQLANALERPLVLWSVIPEREARSIQFLSRDTAASEAVREQFGERLKVEALGIGAREETLSIEVHVGDPAATLQGAATEPGDWLVLGRGAADRNSFAPLGDTTYQLVRKVPASVWVEPSTWEVERGPVLAAIDGSAHSLRALLRAHSVARRLGARLRVVHVADGRGESAGERACADWTREALGAEAEGVDVETRTGDATEGIERACASDPPSLLVLSSLGRGSLLTRWMLGGTVYQVLRHLGCPVLVDREAP